MLFFGVLKDVVGRSEDSLEVPAGSAVAAVFDHYAGRFPRLKEMERSVLLARNREFAEPSAAVGEGDEIAFLPPVSGGSRYVAEITDERGNFFALTREAIDARELAARLLAGEDGAAVTFEGVARNNTNGRPTRYLEYEGYEPMAIKTMAELGRELTSALPISRIGIVHRLGRVEIGEASVVITATAPHRKPAFGAALEAINRLKRPVPIWKKEHFSDGEVWVEGEWSRASFEGKR